VNCSARVERTSRHSRWQREIKDDFVAHYVPWDAGTLSIKVLHFRAAEGSRVFWQLADVAQILGMQENAIARLTRGFGRTWIKVLMEYGVPSCDVIHSHGARTGEKLVQHSTTTSAAGLDVSMGEDNPAPSAPDSHDPARVETPFGVPASAGSRLSPKVVRFCVPGPQCPSKFLSGY
jgi:hypothetical protein